MTSNRQSGQGCRSFGLGNQRAAIRIIRCRAALLEARIKVALQAAQPAAPGTLENPWFSTYLTGDVIF